MKFVLISSLLVLISQGLQAQTGLADLQRQLDELSLRTKTLENENEILKAKHRTNDSIAYCTIRSEIFEAFEVLPGLDFNFKNTSDKIAVTGLFTRLMQANNPTSDILGFRFSEVIINASEKHLNKVLEEEQDKKRFSQVITKIIGNPVVSSLANTNPVTSVVAAIISTIAGFTVSKVELDKEGGRIKDVSVAQQDAFDNGSITAFRNELQVYIDFYDAMLIASSDYIKGLEELERKYAYLIQSVNEYKTELYSELDIKENNMLIGLSKCLPDASINGINYSDLLQDPKIQKSRQLAGKYPVLHQAVGDFKKEYNTLLYKFLADYIKTLKSAGSFPDESIDKAKTENLIIEIESFITGSKIKDREELDAFKQDL